MPTITIAISVNLPDGGTVTTDLPGEAVPVGDPGSVSGSTASTATRRSPLALPAWYPPGSGPSYAVQQAVR